VLGSIFSRAAVQIDIRKACETIMRVEMTENNCIAEIERLWPCPGDRPSIGLLDSIGYALQLHPISARLWCLRGDIWQLQLWDEQFDPNMALECYEKALAVDRTNADANLEVGYLYDVYFNDFVKAEGAFRKAIASGASHTGYFGLARVLAQQGRSEEALNTLAPDQCPYNKNPEIQDLIREISEGLWSDH
jgi:tetratricopeptide (TPR) repeat protein